MKIKFEDLTWTSGAEQEKAQQFVVEELGTYYFIKFNVTKDLDNTTITIEAQNYETHEDLDFLIYRILSHFECNINFKGDGMIVNMAKGKHT